MNTTGYDKLVGEVTNWEDFVIEGGGALGCCGITGGNAGKCKSACGWPQKGYVFTCAKIVTRKYTCCVACGGTKTSATKRCKGIIPVFTWPCKCTLCYKSPVTHTTHFTHYKFYCHSYAGQFTSTKTFKVPTWPKCSKVTRVYKPFIVGCTP
jgi:hypothetical protein